MSLECSICTETDHLLPAIHENNKYSLKGKEQHLFHWDCIKEFFNTRKQYPPCPECRDPITKLGGVDLRLSSLDAFITAGIQGRLDVARSIVSRISEDKRGSYLDAAHTLKRINLIEMVTSLPIQKPIYSVDAFKQAGDQGRLDLARSIADKLSENERGACLTAAHTSGRYDLVDMLTTLPIPEPFYHESATEWVELQLEDRPDLLEKLGPFLSEEHRGTLLSNPKNSSLAEEILYTSGPIDEKGRGGVLSSAIQKKNHTFAKYIATSGSLSKQDRSQCLVQAARVRYSDIQQELLKEPVEDAAYRETFELACQTKDAVIAENISSKIAFQHPDCERYVRQARERGWQAVVHNLLEKGPIGREEWRAVLVDAFLKKDKELVEFADRNGVLGELSQNDRDFLFEKAGQLKWLEIQEKLWETGAVGPRATLSAISEALNAGDFFAARKFLQKLKKNDRLSVFEEGFEELKRKAEEKHHKPTIRDLDDLLAKKAEQEKNSGIFARVLNAASACHKAFRSIFSF